jgi:hypothetical protein
MFPISNISHSLSDEMFILRQQGCYCCAQVLCHVTEGALQVRFLRKSKHDGKSSHSNSNVQQAVVEYCCHLSAARVFKFLRSAKEQLWGKEVIVDWVKQESYSKVSSLTPKHTKELKWNKGYSILLCNKIAKS